MVISVGFILFRHEIKWKNNLDGPTVGWPHFIPSWKFFRSGFLRFSSQSRGLQPPCPCRAKEKKEKEKKKKMVISLTKTFFYTLDTIRFHEIIISFETSSNRLWFSRRFSLSYLKPFCDQNSIWGETLKVHLFWARHVEFGQGKIGIWGAFGRSCSNAIEWIKKKKITFEEQPNAPLVCKAILECSKSLPHHVLSWSLISSCQ